MNTPTKNIAVAGCGYWGKNLVRNFHELGALRTVCDENSAVETMLKEKFPGVNYTADFATVLADPEVKAVALSTPAITHHALAKAALLAGKDVYVEKPLAVEVGQGEELVALAARLGRILMVGHILRYHPAVEALQKLIGEGRLGRLQYVYSNRLNIGKIRTEENILWSFAPHDISVILALLGEMPSQVSCTGSAQLNPAIYDVTMSHFVFPSGVRGHIFVSWLNPFKEQKLVLVGDKGMAVFDDTLANKLQLFEHRVEWKNRQPSAIKAEAENIALPNTEPLKTECAHFLDAIATRKAPLTDGAEGLRVLRVLDACQRAATAGSAVSVAGAAVPAQPEKFVHDTARVDDGAVVGAGTKVWHYAHIQKGARVGARCVIGQNVNIDAAVIGSNVKIQNNVAVYAGVTVEDDVFLGPSCVLTNVSNPRSQVNRRSIYEKTLFKRGCTIGANATILCGLTVGRYALVAAGSVVTKSVPDYALVAGNPARPKGWVSRHGHPMKPDSDGVMTCPESGLRYRETEPGIVRCLDLDEEAPLPPALAVGAKAYREFKTAE